MRTHSWTGSRARLVAVVLALGVALSGGLALAQQGGPRPGGPEGQRLLTPEDREAIGQIYWGRVKERLGLTDEQASDLRSALQTQRQAMRPDLEALRTARTQLRDLLTAASADAAAIQAAAEQVKSLQARLLDQRIQHQLALRAKLTPEQFAKWLELRKGMGHRARGAGHRFGGGLS